MRCKRRAAALLQRCEPAPANHLSHHPSLFPPPLSTLQILEERLAECVSREGVNYVDKCEQLTKRFEAIVRVCQWQVGDRQRERNVGGILDEEKEIQRQLAAEGGAAPA